MKRLSSHLLAFFVGIFVFSCQPSTKETDTEQDEIIVEEEYFAPDEHNARISLDYEGIYEGVLPCADCEGIETTVEIGPSYSFVKKTVYLGKDNDTKNEYSGTYKWNDAGNTIILEGVDAPNQYFVGENVLFHLDMEGNRITGDLADNYALRKKMD
ncbi:copper resistance protein NlpE [Arthrospiribacter ruber]|uniref:Copper resistance protein NlpE n=1 Tax=Arthrospiribacter ruber TaxID=2487934 RepID=A0A951IX99_9BACT|nr:copper resistance protein NlpE [Arthrospiribacter ruber]MBW3467992.1 copper resistance protein NlpE [Arthrospiribacter ruber]